MKVVEEKDSCHAWIVEEAVNYWLGTPSTGALTAMKMDWCTVLFVDFDIN